MTREKAALLITKLAKEANKFLDTSMYNNSFEVWRGNVIRYIAQIFGTDSLQVKSIQEINYPNPSPHPFEGFGGINKLYIPNAIKRFQDTLKSFLEDLDMMGPNERTPLELSSHPKKIFISHSSMDDDIGKEVINLLQLIGINHSKIFYTSAAGFGIPLGKDWVETLKKELKCEGVVLSLLSESYFESQICLLEMGATWVLSKLHIPILIPPLTIKDTNDVINATMWFQVLDRLRWTSLKGELEKLFDLEPLPDEKWEPQRDSILKRIEKHLSTK